MGQKYVLIENGVVNGVYDVDNNNVPGSAVAITDAEFSILNSGEYQHSDYTMVGGALQLTSGAEDARKTRVVDGVEGTEFMRVFVSLLIDEINILRAQHSLPARTMAQFKTAMKNKLT